MQLLCRTLLCRTNCDSRPLWCSLHSHWMFAPCHAHNAPQALTNIRTAAMIANAAITSAPSQHTRVPTNSRHSTMQVLQVNPSSFLFLDQLETPPDAKQLIPYPHQLLQRDIPRLPAPTHLGFVLNPSITTAEDDFASLLHAAALLSEGQVVAVPTETVYGLAANALDADAVQRIFAAKGRPSDNPLIAHVGSIQQAEELLQECDPTHAEHWAHLGAAHGGIPASYTTLVQRYWPGPLTILCPKPAILPAAVTAGQPAAAIRLPAHPVVRALCMLCSFPLAAPSANRSGRPSPTSAQHVADDLSGSIPLVLDAGVCACGIESTVIDGIRQDGMRVVLRPGTVTPADIAAVEGWQDVRVWKVTYDDAALEQTPTTPGMKYRHYTPDADVVLVVPSPTSPPAATQACLENELARCVAAHPGSPVGLLRSSQGGARCGDVDEEEVVVCWLSRGVDAAADDDAVAVAAAQHLFGDLRALEERGCRAIVVEGLREEGQGLAVMNRLRKAAGRIVCVDDGC